MYELIFKRSALVAAVRAMIEDAAGRDHGRGFIELYATIRPVTDPISEPVAEVVEFWTREVAGTGSDFVTGDHIYIGRAAWFDNSAAEGYGPDDFEQYVSDNLRDWTAAKLDEITDRLEHDGYRLDIVEA
jgi:hypothetical protein